MKRQTREQEARLAQSGRSRHRLRPGDAQIGGQESKRGIAWDPQGKFVAVAHNSWISSWEPNDSPGTVLADRGLPLYAFAWRPDGERMAVTRLYGHIQIQNRSGETERTLRQFTQRLDSVSWSPDGHHLATCGTDSTMVIWNADTGEPDGVVLFLDKQRSLTFTPGGQVVDGDPEAVEETLRYIVESPDGSLELLRSSEFQQRVQTALTSAVPRNGHRVQ